jgi:NADH-quinone oxidoreductase subunit N
MIPQIDYLRVLPEIILSVFGMLVMLVDPFIKNKDDHTLDVISVTGIVGALVATFYMACPAPADAFFHTVRADNFSVFFHVVVLLVALATVLMSHAYLTALKIRAGEWYALILLGTVGMGLMASSIELVMIFVAIEISSIATYVLAGFRRNAAESTEASLKYFLLGSFATAFFLYGVSLMFGATGTTNIDQISAVLHNSASPVPAMVYLSIGLMFVGIGFKVSTAPFQIWTPDVYEGAPSPIVAFMSTGPKAAAFAVLLRILFGTSAPSWFWLVWVSAVLSMFVGNIGALVQSNVKRMLAYSSIAHAGYLLVAFASARSSEFAISSAMFYTAAYAAMNVGAFAVVTHFASQGERYTNLEDYSGLGRRSPILAGVFTFFLLSLIGIPITGGFFAKFYVFSAALKSQLIGLTILGVINSAIGAYYYLRLIVYMYMREPNVDEVLPPIRLGMGLALAICVLATLYLGVLPGTVLDFAQASARTFVH